MNNYKRSQPHWERNIMRWYARATPTDIQNGLDWYPNAVTLVESYAGINSPWDRITPAQFQAIIWVTIRGKHV